MVGSVITCVIVSILSFVISFLQFREKGFVFNNAYLYASKKEKEQMNKKPYYRQSAILFLTIGIVFATLSIELFAKTVWLRIIVYLLLAFVIIYAIVSTIYIEIHKNKR